LGFSVDDTRQSGGRSAGTSFSRKKEREKDQSAPTYRGFKVGITEIRENARFAPDPERAEPKVRLIDPPNCMSGPEGEFEFAPGRLTGAESAPALRLPVPAGWRIRGCRAFR